jgi:hypothetical protein
MKCTEFIFSFFAFAIINAGETIQIVGNILCLNQEQYSKGISHVEYGVNISAAVLCIIFRMNSNTIGIVWHILFGIISLSLNIYIYSTYVKSGLEIIFIGWIFSTAILLGVIKEVLKEKLQEIMLKNRVFPTELLNLEKHSHNCVGAECKVCPCIVCKEENVKNVFKMTSCPHELHWECAKAWFATKKEKSCPYCRITSV